MIGIVLALVICFGVTPLFNSRMSKTTHIIRAAGEIKAGEKITDMLVQTVTVGSYNLPSNVLHDSSAVIGKCLTFINQILTIASISVPVKSMPYKMVRAKTDLIS